MLVDTRLSPFFALIGLLALSGCEEARDGGPTGDASDPLDDGADTDDGDGGDDGGDGGDGATGDDGDDGGDGGSDSGDDPPVEEPEPTPWPNISSAEGDVIPAGTLQSGFIVWCYDSAWQSLQGEPGVVSVLRTLRNSPFMELSLVYYNPQETSPAVLQQTLRDRQCPNAEYQDPEVLGGSPLSMSVTSFYVVPNDWTLIKVDVEDGNDITLGLSGEWTFGNGEQTWQLGWGENVVPVRTPATEGTHSIPVTISDHEGNAQELSLELEIISLV